MHCIAVMQQSVCVSLLLIIRTMKLFDYHIQTNVQRNGNFSASFSVPQFRRPLQKLQRGDLALFFCCMRTFLIFLNGFR